MKAARTDYSRRVDWSAVKGDAPAQMRRQVVRFVGGIRGERQGEVTQEDIFAWFSGTPREFVDRGLLDAIGEGEVEPSQGLRWHRKRPVFYSITDKGRAALAPRTVGEFEGVDSNLESSLFVHSRRVNADGSITLDVAVYWTDEDNIRWEFFGNINPERVKPAPRKRRRR